MVPPVTESHNAPGGKMSPTQERGQKADMKLAEQEECVRMRKEIRKEIS